MCRQSKNSGLYQPVWSKAISNEWNNCISREQNTHRETRLGYFLPSTFVLEQTAPRANRRLKLSKSSCTGHPEVTVFTGEYRMEGKMWMGNRCVP